MGNTNAFYKLYENNVGQKNKNIFRKRSESLRIPPPMYSCRIHGAYREYTDYLSHLKNWGLFWTTLCILPLTILLHTFQVRFLYFHMQ